mmetsp:Transcript_14788/g.29205  ORF Transcript_14788/g.29205 Transcript_14788/m.29205 type:complete len:234 (-) Transcript_14788:1089-1790(-)
MHWLSSVMGAWSVIVNFRAYTAVARVLGLSLDTWVRSCGSTTPGNSTARRPRHSATMLRSPSSSAAHCPISRPMMLPTWSAICPAPPAPCDALRVSSWRRDCSNRYLYSAFVWISVRMYGRYLPMAPPARHPSACEAALFVSSEELLNEATMTFSTAKTLRSSSLPISPTQCSSSSFTWSLASGAESSLMKRLMVSSRALGPAAEQRLLTHCAMLCELWRVMGAFPAYTMPSS